MLRRNSLQRSFGGYIKVTGTAIPVFIPVFIASEVTFQCESDAILDLTAKSEETANTEPGAYYAAIAARIAGEGSRALYGIGSGISVGGTAGATGFGTTVCGAAWSVGAAGSVASSSPGSSSGCAHTCSVRCPPSGERLQPR